MYIEVSSRKLADDIINVVHLSFFAHLPADVTRPPLTFPLFPNCITVHHVYLDDYYAIGGRAFCRTISCTLFERSRIFPGLSACASITTAAGILPLEKFVMMFLSRGVLLMSPGTNYAFVKRQ